MTQYAVLVNGQNYLLTLEGKTRRVGFFLWRCLEAKTQEEANEQALQMVHTTPELTGTILNPPDDPPLLNIEETRVGWGDLKPPGTGFIFVSEEEEAPRSWLGKFTAWLRGQR